MMNTVFTEWATANVIIPIIIENSYDPKARMFDMNRNTVNVSIININESDFMLIPPEDRDLFQKLILEFSFMVVEQSGFDLDKYMYEPVNEITLNRITNDFIQKIKQLEYDKDINIKHEFMKVLGVEATAIKFNSIISIKPRLTPKEIGEGLKEFSKHFEKTMDYNK